MSFSATFSFPPTLDEQSHICTLLATRMEQLLHREHTRVMYFEALSRQLAQACESRSGKGRSWLSRLGLLPCVLTKKCVSDMAASVAMALHVMQMELQQRLAQGQGMEHPLAMVLVDRLDCGHDDVMRAMRMFFYQRVDMVREGLLHHQRISNVALCCNDIERWIDCQSRIVDKFIVPNAERRDYALLDNTY